MKITGITIIKNAILNDYPVLESIQSILPVVDEMIVSIGDSDDDTEGLIKSLSSEKIRIIHSVWDKSIRKGGSVLAVETNKALKSVSPDTDWIFYIQADEVIHEKYHEIIRSSAEKHLVNNKVDGLLFHYLHFYGTYQYVGDSRKWYSYETRIIRNNRNIESYRDAQGFRIKNKKINVALIDAFVYHYGWVKSPKDMKIKQKNVAEFWIEDDNLLSAIRESEDFFDYTNVDSIKLFEGTHPVIMQDRIKRKNWNIQLDVNKKNLKLKYRLLSWIEKWTGKKLFSFSNHKIIRGA
jgi:hypothetical protein